MILAMRMAWLTSSRSTGTPRSLIFWSSRQSSHSHGWIGYFLSRERALRSTTTSWTLYSQNSFHSVGLLRWSAQTHGFAFVGLRGWQKYLMSALPRPSFWILGPIL